MTKPPHFGTRNKDHTILTCIPRSKHGHNNGNGNGNSVNNHHRQRDEDRDNDDVHTPNSKLAIKSLTSQIKGIALKASGAYKCNNNPSNPSPGSVGPGHLKTHADPEPDSNPTPTTKTPWTYRRTASQNSSSSTTPRWGKELEARLKGLSMGSDSTVTLSASASCRRVDPVVLIEENEPKEWVAQVEPGVLIDFVSLPRGGNDLKRIRFSRDMFNKMQAQKWWTENYEKIMELYNVQRLSRNAFPLPLTPRSEDEISKMDSVGDGPITPPLTKESLPHNLYRGMGMGYSSSDSFEQHSKQSRHHNDQSSGLASTPTHSTMSGVTAKTETSSMDESTSSRDADRSGELSISNASDVESEWVEEDEPGVYITIRALPGGRRELRRVRFSREKFGEMHARVWWEENRGRIHEQYL
ncbi:hypothetical protein vseg_000688 [Gypsophila vaccaria]